MGTNADEGGDTRERIANAAAELFAERGFARTSIRQIAERASANSALIYYYFGSKQGLLESLVAGLQTLVRSNLERAVAGPGGARERLERFIRLQVRLIRRRAPLARLVLREVLNGNGVVVAAARRAILPNLELVCGLIEEGMAAGEFRRMDAELAARTLMGSVLVPVALAPLITDRRVAARRLEDHVVDLYLGGLRP